MLEVRGLTKRFRELPAVDNVSFTAPPGEVTGYLGPNGSGKTTTVKMITGLLAPSQGEILYGGESVFRNLVEYKRIVGYVPEEPFLYSYLTGAEYLEMVGELRGIHPHRLREKIDEFLKLFGLWGDRYTPISSYSKGMRQKILISAALLHNPQVVVLDEPFSGLDVASTIVMKRLIPSLAEAGKIVLYSSHVLEVVEKVCSKVVILHRGKVVANDSVSRLSSLMELPSLEEIFTELVIEQDTEGVVGSMIEVMRL